jgi:NAD(P)-dependent dehydrogenase (short-subunit alcohol dehydrogenase family)
MGCFGSSPSQVIDNAIAEWHEYHQHTHASYGAVEPTGSDPVEAIAAGRAPWEGCVAIVTGPTSGIGYVTARELAQVGFHVILAGRDTNGKLEHTRDRIHDETGIRAELTCIALDLGSFASVRKFVKTFQELELPLHLLINNAGVYAGEYNETEDGFEQTMGVNVLGHHLLTRLLMEDLKRTTASRVVFVASELHRQSQPRSVDWPTIMRPGDDDFWSMTWYAHSKLANVLQARYFAQLFDESKSAVTAYSLHPGAVRTGIGHDNTLAKCFMGTFSCCMRSPDRGASTTLYCALHPGLEQYSGSYFNNCRLQGASAHGSSDALSQEVGRLFDDLVKAGDVRV